MMANPTDALKAEKNAEKHFRNARSQEVPLKKSVRAERALDAAKTAKLRALRLAKEQADKAEAEKIAAENPKPKPRSRKPAKPAKMVRMIY
jgi:hypothetical protein